MLSAQGVSMAFRAGVWSRRCSLAVLHGADLELACPAVVGLVGTARASTFMKILVGALARGGGTIGHADRIGRRPQESVLYERLTCDEHPSCAAAATACRPPRSTLPVRVCTTRSVSAARPRTACRSHFVVDDDHRTARVGHDVEAH